MITVRISFEKKNEASYISLLDLQRVMQRVLKRSGLPVWHTLGFNPHIYMTFACPLSLGQESECECVDVKTEAENPDFAQWLADEGISSISLNPDSVIDTWQQLAAQ